MATTRNEGNAQDRPPGAGSQSAQGILFPTDFSSHAASAWPYAVGLARRGAAELHVLHVVTPPPMLVSPDGGVLASPALVEEVLAEAEGVVEELVGSAHAVGVKTRTHTAIGDPASEIVACAEAEGIGLIVMSTTGRTGLARAFLGSVAERVVRRAPCPVLTIRHDPLATPPRLATGTLPRLQRILAPLDGSALAEAALPPLVALAKRHAAQLVLLRVAYARGLGKAALAEAQLAAVREAESYLTGVAHRLAADGVRAACVVRVGSAAAEILDDIQGKQPDLVAMSTHGRTGLTHLVLGSVAEEVLRVSPVPVLLFPARALRATGAETPAEHQAKA
jgi:nucleotide-binding universal stress UspA family protein